MTGRRDNKNTPERNIDMKDYYLGKVDLDTAWENFYTAITEALPNLKK